MRIFKQILFFSLIFFFFCLKSQSSAGEIKKLYHYTFEGTLALESVSAFEQRLSQLPFVNSAKVKYKSQAQKGELFIETTEPAKSFEGEKSFDLIELKKLIQSYNLNPNELKISQQ